MVDGSVGLVGRHFLLGCLLLVPVVSGLAHAIKILWLLSSNSIALSYHHLTLTLPHSRVLLGVMLAICSPLNESGWKLNGIRDAWLLLVSYGSRIDGGCLAILHIILLLSNAHHWHLVHWYDYNSKKMVKIFIKKFCWFVLTASVVSSWRKWAIHNISLSMVVLGSLDLLLVSNHLAISL